MMKTKLISVRVPEQVAKRLDRLAAATQRSTSFVAAQAIEEFLSLQEWQVKAIQDAMDEADAGKLASHEVARRRLAGWKRTRGG